MVSVASFTVAWFAALWRELVAAEEHLDEQYEDLEGFSGSDANSYTLGRIGRHNIVIVTLPAGSMGKASAAAAVRDMLRTFPNVRIGLMVGIGGGAPTPSRDIRLGDVVVSVASDEFGGVCPYDYGKAIQNAEFKRTGVLDSPPASLRTVVSTIQAKHERHGHQIAESIDSIVSANKRLHGYAQPPESADVLFRTDFIHTNLETECLEGCAINQHTTVHRKPRSERENNPEIFYGTIASADQVLRDAEKRDAFAAKHGVLCFEMEAAGIMNLLGCLVIRGISDYSDSHKNKVWQGYAAMTAAAYAKELLLKLAPSKVEHEQKLLDKIDAKVDEVQATLHLQEQQKFIKDLKLFDFTSKITSIRELVTPGSGQWFLRSTVFQSWFQGHDQLLWCPGSPGAGKTVMTSIVIGHLQATLSGMLDPKPALAYIYFDYGYKEQTKVWSLLVHVWTQVLQQRFLSQSEVRAFAELFEREKGRPSLSAVANLIANELDTGKFSSILIVIDALDECPTGALSFISTLLSLRPQIRLLVTSRNADPYDEIPCKHLQIHAIDEDVQLYVDTRIDLDKGILRCVQRDPSLRSLIRETIQKSAEGLFLLCTLNFNTLSEADDSPRSLRAALNQIPSGPNRMAETYAKTIARIKEQDVNKRTLALRTIKWVAYARRPLDADELILALSIQPGDQDVDEFGFVMKRHLLSYCAGLIDIQPHSGEVRFKHQTTQEYFDTVRHDPEFADAHLDIALACLTFLNFQNSDFPTFDQILDHGSTVYRYPFFGYSAVNTGYHFCAAEHGLTVEQAPRLQTLALLLRNTLENRDKVNRAGAVIGHKWRMSQHGEPNHDRPPRDEVSPADLAAYYNVLGSGNALLQASWKLPRSDAAASNESYGTELHWAVLGRANESCAAMLTSSEFNVDIDVQNYWGFAAVAMAAKQGSELIVEHLLRAGCNFTQYNSSEMCDTVLHTAIRGVPLSSVDERLVVINTILRHDADGQLVNRGDIIGASPLSLAVQLGDRSIFKAVYAWTRVILGKDIWRTPENRFRCDRLGRTVLHWAVTRSPVGSDHSLTKDPSQDSSILQDLLSDPLLEELIACRKRDGLTAFEMAVRDDHVRAIELLMREFNRRGLRAFFMELYSGLLVAACEGTVSTFFLVFSAINDEHWLLPPMGDSILHRAARNRRSDMVRALTEAFPHLALERCLGPPGSPLHEAALSGHHEAAELLLSLDGSMLHASDAQGNSPLHLAATFDHLEVCRTLLRQGADPDLVNVDGVSAIEVALRQRSSNVAPLLLARSRKVNFRIDGAAGVWLEQQPWNGSKSAGQHTGSQAYRPYAPSCSDDIFTVALCLKHLLVEAHTRLGHSSGASLSKTGGGMRNRNVESDRARSQLDSYILDLAEYWLRSTSGRVEERLTQWHDKPRAYLTSQPISGSRRAPVRRVIFHVEAHDQGFVDDPRRGNWTWFTALAASASSTGVENGPKADYDHGANSVMSHEGPRITCPDLATSQYRTHVVQWDSGSGTDADSEHVEWMRALAAGDVIQIVPHAHFMGWQNWVASARMEIYTSCVKERQLA